MAPGGRQTRPNSYYAIPVSGLPDPAANVSVVAAPGGAYDDHEPVSRIVGPSTWSPFLLGRQVSPNTLGPFSDLFPGRSGSTDTDLLYERSTPNLASFRLVAADGDVAG